MKKQPFDDAPARSGPLISFYETTLISSRAGKTPVGVQVLASPPEIEGVRIRYENLLEDIASAGSLRRAESRPDDYFGLRRVLSVVADPELARYTEREDWFADVLAGELPPHRLVSDRFVVRLLENPLVAAEASPFGKRSLAELLGLGAFVGVGVVTGIPFVVITGGSVGLIVGSRSNSSRRCTLGGRAGGSLRIRRRRCVDRP